MRSCFFAKPILGPLFSNLVSVVSNSSSMSTVGAESSKKRKKAVYRDADEPDATPAKRFKFASAEDLPDLKAYEQLDETAALTIPATNKEQIPKKKKQMGRPKKKTEPQLEKSNHSALLLILFGLIRKCRQERREARTTSAISIKLTRKIHSMYTAYFKIEISTSVEIFQDDINRIVNLLTSNSNETAFANLDQTIQIRTTERSSGIQREWILTEENISSVWHAKQSRSPLEPKQNDLLSSVTLFLCGDVYGEFYTIEPVLEECMLFNPYIAFNYQLDDQPAVTLNAPIEYKPSTFNSTILLNITAYYMPEKMLDHKSGKDGKNLVHVLVNCQSDSPVNRPFIEVKIIQDGIVALPTQQIVEQLLNKNWNGDYGIGIELDEMIVADVPIGYYFRTSAGEASTISNILVIIEHNNACKAFDFDKPIVVGPTIVSALVNSFKELKETMIELVSKREMAKLQDFQIATEELTESISNIIEISTNADFVQRCMDRLEIDNMESLRPALQQLIETSVEKFMPRAVQQQNLN